MDPIEIKLTELTGVITTFRDKAQDEMKTLGSVTADTAAKVTALQTQLDALDVKLAEKHSQSGDIEKPLIQELKEIPDLEQFMRKKSGRVVFELTAAQAAKLQQKTVFLSSGTGTQPTTSVLRIDRMPGITLEARQELTIRDVLSSAPTTMQVVDYVKVSTPLAIASPQVEGSAKAENTVTFTALSERVKTIATFIRASKQILDDFTELMNFLQSSLPYYTRLAEEQQLLSGNATGENLNGLITQAQAFNTGLLHPTAGYNKIDYIGRAIQQVTGNKEIRPTFCILHPNDWWDMRLTKDGFGRYILGDPQAMVAETLFGLTVVPTTTMTAGQFLVGNGNPAASQIRDRMGVVVDISTEDANNFTTNLVTVRSEERLALIVRRPNSFLNGALVASPVVS